MRKSIKLLLQGYPPAAGLPFRWRSPGRGSAANQMRRIKVSPSSVAPLRPAQYKPKDPNMHATTPISAYHYVMECLGTEATLDDAQMVIDLATKLAAEQGDDQFDAVYWASFCQQPLYGFVRIVNRDYHITELWEAANGNVAALAMVRAEAGLPVVE